jgi:hypothetical protein
LITKRSLIGYFYTQRLLGATKHQHKLVAIEATLTQDFLDAVFPIKGCTQTPDQCCASGSGWMDQKLFAS